jgi:hypothetical protein
MNNGLNVLLWCLGVVILVLLIIYLVGAVA